MERDSLGHTGILLFLVAGLSITKGSARGIALSLGIVSHLILDVMGDSLELFDQSATVQAILFPLLRSGFSAYKPVSAVSQVSLSIRSYYIWTSEIAGLVLLLIYFYLFYKKLRAGEYVFKSGSKADPIWSLWKRFSPF